MPLHPGVRRSASAHLKQPRRPKPKEDKLAAASADASAVLADQSGNKRRGRKRKSAESVDNVKGSQEPADDVSGVSKADAQQKGKRKQVRASKEADPSDGDATQQQAKGKASAKSNKGKESAVKGKKLETDEADLQLQDDLAAACVASLTAAEANGSQQKPAKRIGDIELENQLAMAMASTAAEAKHRTQSKATVHDEPMPSAFSPRAGGRKPTLGETWVRDARLATQDLAQSEAANHWAEVFCGSAETGKWIHVDPLLGWIDAPDKVEGAGVRPGGLAYVVAFASSGAKDVTQRYVGSVLAADKMRDNAWWEETLKPLRKHEVAATTQHHKALQLNQSQQGSPAAAAHSTQSAEADRKYLPGAEGQLPAALYHSAEQGQHPTALPHSATQGPLPTALPILAGPSRGGHGTDTKTAARAAELVKKREDAELSQRAASERQGLPSNVEGFKHHPVFVLERHISRYFALKPGTKKAGMHRGEAFYPREALAELHTADRWLRDGLEVRPEELGKPYKVVKRRGVKDAPQADPNGVKTEEEEGQEELSVIPMPDATVTKMYGRWQTQQWQVPTAVGGVVPKNDRGNVHCPPLASELPKGTVHLQMPRLGPICKKLGIDYAPAMTGFDIRGGRSVPVIEGVVICKEEEATVLEAYLEDERLREERTAERRKQEADAAWRQLLRSIWTRLRLNQDYGDNAAAHAGQDHAHEQVIAPREEISGGSAELVDLVQHQAGPSAAETTQEKDAALVQDHLLINGDGMRDDAGGQLAANKSNQKRTSRGSRGKQTAAEQTVSTAATGEKEEIQGQAGTRLKRHSRSGIEVEMEEI